MEANELLEMTREEILEQGSLPMSPCVVGNLSGGLCAAASLVYIGLREEVSSEVADTYREELVATGDKGLVIAGAKLLEGRYPSGLFSESSIREIFDKNDSLVAGARVLGVNSYFERLKLN